jgi:pimeloyl-ACP methyl ester carboxylesterase
VRVLIAALCGLVVARCYRLTTGDIFEIPFQPVSPMTLGSLSDAEHRVVPLHINAPRPVSAYWDHGDSSRGVLIVFDGNGYGAEAALRRMLIPARALRLDLIAFNYYDQGQRPPSMTEMRAIGDALFDAAAGLPTIAARSIYLGGHSLGATFAFTTAIDRPARGLFVAGPVTTGVAMIRHQLPASRLVWLRPDTDYKQLDNLALAPRVRVPALIVGSSGDDALPPQFTHAVFRALPNDILKREIILSNVAHPEYFAQETFWRDVAEFFALPLMRPIVGYLP